MFSLLEPAELGDVGDEVAAEQRDLMVVDVAFEEITACEANVRLAVVRDGFLRECR